MVHPASEPRKGSAVGLSYQDYQGESMSMKHGKLHKIDYVLGKSRSKEGAESLRLRTQETLDALPSLGQTARVTKIANGFGEYGYRVNVTSEVE